MSTLTLEKLETICHQIAALPKAEGAEFQPTAKQLYFFTLVWLLKKKVAWESPQELLVGQSVVTLTSRAQLVAQHLSDWGKVVTELEQGNEKEWELLRIQLEKVTKCYPSPLEEQKVDVVQDSLLKIFNLLKKMIPWPHLETADIPALVFQIRPSLTNLYDFGSPFYAFARRLTQNELLSQLRRESCRPRYPIPLEDLVDVLPDPSSSTFLEADDEIALQALCLRLKIDMANLLEIVQHHLTAKPAQVILHSVGGRVEFWRAIEITGLMPPDDLSPQMALATDAGIAQALGMTENSVRASRSQAKKLVQRLNPMAGLLLESFLARHGKISYR